MARRMEVSAAIDMTKQKDMGKIKKEMMDREKSSQNYSLNEKVSRSLEKNDSDIRREKQKTKDIQLSLSKPERTKREPLTEKMMGNMEGISHRDCKECMDGMDAEHNKLRKKFVPKGRNKK